MIRGFDAVLLATEPEAALLRRRLGESNPEVASVLAGRVHVVANGTDFRPDSPGSDDRKPVVGFVGTMNYWPNIDAVVLFAH